MKVQNPGKVATRLRKLGPAVERQMVKAIRRNTNEGVRVAKALAPDVTGETRRKIRAQFKEGGLIGEVVAIDSDAPRYEKDRAYSIEHGRKKGERGVTEGSHHMHRTRQHLAKKHKASLRRALRKGIKEASGNG